MTFLTLVAVAFFAYATTLGPWLDTRRKARREVDRCGRIDMTPRPHATTAPRFTRDDPSPRPRRITDYEWRAIAEGDMQT